MRIYPFGLLLLFSLLMSCGGEPEVREEPTTTNTPTTDAQEEENTTVDLKAYQKLLEDNRQARLENPPEIPATTFMRSGESRNTLAPCRSNQALSDVVSGCDYFSAITRNQAIRLAAAHPGNYNLGQMANIFDYAKKNWKYVNDPLGREYVAKASETIGNDFTGDCDDFAVVLASMLMAVGGDVRINYAFQPNAGHAFVEANLGSSNPGPIIDYLRARYEIPYDKSIHVRKDRRTGNLWLNMDWFADYPGGPYFRYTEGTSYYIIDQSCEAFTQVSDAQVYQFAGKDNTLRTYAFSRLDYLEDVEPIMPETKEVDPDELLKRKPTYKPVSPALKKNDR